MKHLCDTKDKMKKCKYTHQTLPNKLLWVKVILQVYTSFNIPSMNIKRIV